ncbi:MAG: APC family permease [Candidatus Bathyarchaeales archaeon]
MAVFARKASGLVREASLFDAFSYGFFDQAVGACIWAYTSFGLFVVPRGDLMVGILLGLVLGVAGAFVWGILGASMPRSGGDYVYNSRIIHPVVGTIISVSSAWFILIMWNGILCGWVIYGLTHTLGLIGASYELIDWFWSTQGLLICCFLIQVIAATITSFGWRKYAVFQKFVMAIAMAGLVISAVLLTINGPQQFIASWNAVSAEYGSISYNELLSGVEAQGFTVTGGYELMDTLGLITTSNYFTMYGYMISFIGGEIKRPQRNVLLAQLLAVIVPVILASWVTWAAIKTTGIEFLRAGAYIDNAGYIEGYALPFSPIYTSAAAVLTDNIILKFLIGFQLALFSFMYIPVDYLASNRAMFAWGMDQIGPSVFTDINATFGTPLKNQILIFLFSMVVSIMFSLNPELLWTFSVVALETLTLFVITGISGTIFPFVRKVKHIWEASPYKNWKLAGIPVVTLAGVVYIAMLLMSVYFYWVLPAIGFLHPLWDPIYVAVWLFGILWFVFWYYQRKRQGIDILLAFKELPPE